MLRVDLLIGKYLYIVLIFFQYINCLSEENSKNKLQIPKMVKGNEQSYK